ncbi:tetratricopeptide repeat protein [Streptomyces nanshensis]|uniref:tetratricopeptide repeat protein n=1 Tax=Streptomyces nanshensis TaxID=518642 RepID=UPI00085C635F|nr:tetratricopeptide repeat protein [Streptomyces nanshensis]
MDLIVPSMEALLKGVIEGTGGEVGRQLWAGLRLLVSRERGEGHRDGDGQGRSTSGGPAEDALRAFEADPRDPVRLAVLGAALTTAAQSDPQFLAHFDAWRQRASALPLPSNAAGAAELHSPAAERIESIDERLQPLVPRHLRPPLAHFTNRTAELLQLDQAAQTRTGAGGTQIVVVSGGGGIGKTALVEHWLHRRAADFRDGVLHADLAATAGDHRAQIHLVLSGLLRSLGVAGEQVPATADEASILFRQITARSNLAVHLDNAESDAQVEALLPTSPESTVVVTSRHLLGGLNRLGARFIHVQALAPEAGRELLRRSLGEDRVAAEFESSVRLVELCGGHPLALALTAGSLATRPQQSLDDAVQQLTEDRRHQRALRREISITSNFDGSYDALTDEQQVAYRRLGFHPRGEFSLQAAAAALALPVHEARQRVDDLVEVSLLEIRGERYAFHDVVRSDARERAEWDDDHDQHRAVICRLLEHYVALAAAADAVVAPQEWRLGEFFPSPGAPPAYSSSLEALEALERDLPTLMAMLRAGGEYGAHALVWQLAEAMWHLFLRRKHIAEWELAYRLGIAAARRCADDAALARMHYCLGLAFHDQGRRAEALTAGQDALRVARRADHDRLTAHALGLIGMARREQGDVKDAVAALAEAVALDHVAERHRDAALSRRRLGQTLLAADKIAEAIDELTKSRDLAERIGDPDVKAMTTVWLADAYTRAGDPAHAEEFAAQAAGLLADSGSSKYRAQAYMVCGEAAAAQGRLTTARDHLQRAKAFFIEAGAPDLRRVEEALTEVTNRLSDASAQR